MGNENSDKELLIRLEEKVDTILDKISIIPALEERIRYTEKEVYGIPDIKKDIEKLEEKSNTWSIINSIGVFIAGLFGFLGR
jgi:hypothetical protein